MERKKQWRIIVTKEQWDERNNGPKGRKKRQNERNNVRIKGTKETMNQGDERNNGVKEQWIKGMKEQWNERSNGGSK